MLKFCKVLFVNFKPTAEIQAVANEIMSGIETVTPKIMSVVSVVERIGVAFICRLEVTSRNGVLSVVSGSSDAALALEAARTRLLGQLTINGWRTQPS